LDDFINDLSPEIKREGREERKRTWVVVRLFKGVEKVREF
jgi:hypothetical protein